VTLWIGLGWVCLAGSAAVLLGAIVWMLLFRTNAEPADLIEDSSIFEIADYRPMEHLLDPQDLVFLQAQPGYRPAMGVRWKRERHRIFRLYFTELKADFHRLHAQARRLVAHADRGSADLVGALMHERWVFTWATLRLEFRLALAWAGIGEVDARPLLALVEAMRADLSRRSVLLKA
jgi:hypothetical protein